MLIDARPLAVARIGIGLALLLTVVETHGILMPVAQGRVAMPWADGLPALTPALVCLVTALTLAAGLAVTVGYRLPWAATVAAVVNAGLVVWEQQTYSSHRVLFALLCLYLAFSRADAAWSWRGRAARPVPWWPAALMLSQVSVCYLFGGLSKINPVFLSGAVLEHAMWLPLPEVVLAGIPLLTVVSEVFLAFGLWLPRLRWLAAGVGVCLHLMIVATMEQPLPLVAFAAACLSTYPLFLARPVTSTSPARAGWTAAGSSPVATPAPR